MLISIVVSPVTVRAHARVLALDSASDPERTFPELSPPIGRVVDGGDPVRTERDEMSVEEDGSFHPAIGWQRRGGLAADGLKVDELCARHVALVCVAPGRERDGY